MSSKILLPKVKNLQHVDYAREIYRGNNVIDINFKPQGYVYGPIRLSLDEGPIYEHINKPLIDSDILLNTKLVAMVRDPRDILVSFYYSITKSHTFSRVSEIRELQETNRERWINEGLEGYLTEKSPTLNKQFELLISILKSNKNSYVLRFEDMVDDFPVFRNTIRSAFDLENSALENIYKNTRPQIAEDEERHRRSGKTRGFKEKISAKQIGELNATLMKSLAYFDYD
ncbi:MAG: sulfotransferase domain-containing protein [Oceanicoccus sp.]